MRQPTAELVPGAGRPTAVASPERANGLEMVPPRQLWTGAAVVALGSTASILSSTVVNVAVPDLENTFHAPITSVQWVMTAYLLGLASVIPISGYLSDRFGTRRVYLVTLVAFTVASGLCGVAWSLGSEIGFRVLQGIAGGMVMPVGMTIVMRMAGPHARGRVMSILGVPMMLGPAFGPTVGGWLIQSWNWRFIFWVNIPAGVLAFALGWFFLRKSPPVPVGRVDWVGLLMATPAVTAVIYGLTQAVESGWGSPQALVPLVGGLVVAAAFVVWELRRPSPLLDMRVFTNGAFAGAVVVGVILASALFGAVFLVPVFMQQVQGYDTLQAGLLLAPQGLAAAVAMPASGLLTDRIGARPVVMAGVLALLGATLLLTGIDVHTTKPEWALIMVLRGVGMGFAMMPAFAAAYATMLPAAISRATAVSNTMQRVASSLGIAVFATVLSSRVAAHPFHAPTHAQMAHLGATGVKALALAGVAKSFDETFWLASGVVAFGLPAAMLLRRPLPPGELLAAQEEGRPLDRGLGRAAWLGFAALSFVALVFLAYCVGRAYDLTS